ncbi:hypothetical protein [Faecalibacterium hattorii]|uniref:hypothetical protein n=1 Tax=Faecalibacterium hattorii TaxID=2935520 RepID=UPI003AAC5C35
MFYYFLTQQVKALVQGMADAFPGGVLVFDAANRTAVKMIAKTWLRTAKIKGCRGRSSGGFGCSQEIGEWDSRLRVSSRGYLLGYRQISRVPFRWQLPVSGKGQDNGMKCRS